MIDCQRLLGVTPAICDPYSVNVYWELNGIDILAFYILTVVSMPGSSISTVGAVCSGAEVSRSTVPPPSFSLSLSTFPSRLL